MKRKVSLLLVMVLCICLLAACGKKQETGKTGNETTGTKTETTNKEDNKTEEKKEEEVTESVETPEEDGVLTELTLPLTDTKENLKLWMRWENEFISSPSEIKAVQVMEEQTNVHIEYVTATALEAGEKFGLMIASGDLPDIMFNSTTAYNGGLSALVEDGIIIDMTDLIQKYMPNYRGILAENDDIRRDVTSDDGRQMAACSISRNDEGYNAERAWYGLVVRQDWLTELGLEHPVTIDDWTVMLRAFRDEKGASAPLTVASNGSNAGHSFASAYGVTTGLYLDGDTIKFGPAQMAYKDWVDQMASWYAEGLLDPNFMSAGFAAGIMADSGNVATNVHGAFTTINGLTGDVFKFMGFPTDEDFYVTGVQNPVLNKGDVAQYRNANTCATTIGCMITTPCKNPELAAKWIDYQYSHDAMVLNNYGIEGETYYIDDAGVYHLTDMVLNNEEGLTYSQVLCLNTMAGPGNCYGIYNWGRLDDTVVGEVDNCMSVWSKDGTSMIIPSFITLTIEESEIYSKYYVNIETLAQEKTVKCIMGADTTDNYEEFIEELYGYGLQEVLDVYQAAYDRYRAR